jgi:hypothetical protein
VSDLGPGRRIEVRTTHERDFVRKVTWRLGTVGVAAALSGMITGIVMADHNYVVQCPDGHVTPVGADPNCYSYPELGLGISIALLSVALGVLILLACAGLFLLATPRQHLR